VRLDHTYDPKLSFFFRFGDTSSSTASRADIAVQSTRSDIQTYTLGATSSFSTRWSNEFRLGYDRSTSSQVGTLDNFGGAVPIDLAEAVGAGGFKSPSPVLEFSIDGIGFTAFGYASGQNLGRQ
jgi:hypothetical protein